MKDVSKSVSKMTDEQLEEFVRGRLAYGRHALSETRSEEKPHKRFDMSGYGDRCGSCQLHNTAILNLFADCGIYNKILVIYLVAYKGTMVLYYTPWGEAELHSVEYGGWGTVDILCDIIKRMAALEGMPRRVD